MLATLIPIGLLLIGFEIRSVPTIVSTGTVGLVMLWISGAALVVALYAGFAAERILVIAVVTDTEVSVADTGWVVWGLYLLWYCVFVLLFLTLTERLGILRLIGKRANNRVYASERRLARRMQHIEKHHPGWREDS